VAKAFLANNKVPAEDVPEAVRLIHSALAEAAEGRTPEMEEISSQQRPAVSIGRSIKPDYLISLEDGFRYKSLKRHLKSKYGLTPDEYRAKWGLPKSYPMVAPNFHAARSALAKKIGLGRTTSKTTPSPEEQV
jgi:predicted transcriptional regulator